jgi:hypothetical protein
LKEDEQKKKTRARILFVCFQLPLKTSSEVLPVFLNTSIFSRCQISLRLFCNSQFFTFSIYYNSIHPNDYMLYLPANTKNGSGHFAVDLVDIRGSYGFRYVQGKEAPYHVVAESPAVTFKYPLKPSQGHIALTGKLGEMRIQW